MGDPIVDPFDVEPPRLLVQRTAYLQADQLATVRLPGDKQKSEAPMWFASTQHPGPGRKREVEYLIDGWSAFSEMAAAMATATDPKQHFVYALGWTMYRGCPLQGKKTIGDCFQELSDRGVPVRVMLWDGWGAPIPEQQDSVMTVEPVITYKIANHVNYATVDFVNGLACGQAILDNRYASNGFASHHQKVIIVNGSWGLLAFCGGIDVNPDRIFPKGVRDAEQDGGPMHDVHCRVRGPAAADLLKTFVERWTDFIKVRSVTEKAPLVGASTPNPPPAGTLRVQIGRTYPNPVHGPRPLTHSLPQGSRRSAPCSYMPSAQRSGSSTSRTSTR